METASLALARDAASWIRSRPVSPLPDLYRGTAGVVWFFLELARSTGDASYLTGARARADALLAALEREKDCGLYTGLSGIGFALRIAYEATGEARYLEGARRCTSLVGERALRAGRGVEWPGQVTDIDGGGAGIGLFLLWQARREGTSADRDLARLAGDRLVELGRPAEGGLTWTIDPVDPVQMPNFAHGTAGVAYFLATLASETREPAYLDAALAGARYLTAVARTEGDVCLVFHHEPGGRNLYYWGWCHGPVGTARLFHRLFEVTADHTWKSWVERCARALLMSGIPEETPPGFWDNVGPCCGLAGIAELFLALTIATGDARCRDLMERVHAEIVSRAGRDGRGASWTQAEHRVHPELREAQTGYMQGAAGVGIWLLRHDAFLRGASGPEPLPDSPFFGPAPAH